MSEAEALAAALVEDPQVDYWAPEKVKVLRLAARERLTQLPEKCDMCLGEKRIAEWVTCPSCHGKGFLYPPALVERIALAVGEMFLYPDPNREGNWMGPGIQAARQVAVAVLDALTETP